jgi:hypothetical protein
MKHAKIRANKGFKSVLALDASGLRRTGKAIEVGQLMYSRTPRYMYEHNQGLQSESAMPFGVRMDATVTFQSLKKLISS